MGTSGPHCGPLDCSLYTLGSGRYNINNITAHFPTVSSYLQVSFPGTSFTYVFGVWVVVHPIRTRLLY